MNFKQAVNIIEAAKKKPELLARDAYIEAQTRVDWFTSICFEMGPNCNRRCSGCYGNFGPKRKGLPKVRIIKKALEEAVELDFFYVGLTDGEALRHENREVVRLFAEYSERLPVGIKTNGVFAKTWDNTLNWLRFLKDNGFNLASQNNSIDVSCGPMYQVSLGNYHRINHGVREVFPGIDYGKSFGYSFLRIDPLETEEDETRLLEKIILLIGDCFSKKSKVPIKIVNKESEKKVKVIVDTITPITINYDVVSANGRAYNLPICKLCLPEKTFNPEDLSFEPESEEILAIRSNGRVGFRGTSHCIRQGHLYGNLQDNSLTEIMREISRDPVYIGWRLGGAKFLYTLARELDSSLTIVGRTKCDVCHYLFSDKKRLGEIREYLGPDLEGKYKNYINRQLNSA